MNAIRFAIVTLAVFLIQPIVQADVNGADPRLTGAPGESTCSSCHNGTAINAGGGSVQLILPNGNTYTPGVKQRISVKVSDASQKRWGFELSARLVSNLSTGQAGDFLTIDSNVQVKCSNNRAKPCAATSPVQYVTHTTAGTRLGTTGSATFDFDWTPPATDVGNIRFYAVGNAANGNTAESGDHIYSTTLDVTPASATIIKPTITSTRGIVNAASYAAGAAPNTWITISGANLSTTTRIWTGAEVASGRLPTALDGVSVTINGKAAYMEYISPTQLNLIAPADDTRGPVEVKVTANGVTSDPITVNLDALLPGLFTFDGKYLAAAHADNSLLGKSGLFASAPTLTTAAKPEETIVMYGTGFGPTSPAIPAGQLTDQLASISGDVAATIGGVSASLSFAGLVPPYAQLYQFNIKVPDSLPDGDHAVIVTVNSVSSPAVTSCCFITLTK